MPREQGYYTVFKGKWHLSETPHSEDTLERYAFVDYQQWGGMFGSPLQGEQLDGTATFETVDWLEHKAAQLDQAWLLVCSLVNPHDIMFLRTDPMPAPNPNGMVAGIQTTVQGQAGSSGTGASRSRTTSRTIARASHPVYGTTRNTLILNYGRIPDERTDLWLKHRNYLIDAMRLVDAQLVKVLDALDRLDLWRNTVVMFTSDHGEMNAAHRLTQKANITFDEAAVVNLTVCVPGPLGRGTTAVGSHLDLAPTLLTLTGLSEQEIHERYPHLKGRSLMPAMLDSNLEGHRGSVNAPDGALFSWDGLHALDNEWDATGALKALTDLSPLEPTPSSKQRHERLEAAGEAYDAPDFSKRTFFRAVVDGRYKHVRWFNPEEYGNPGTIDELYAYGDVGLYDLVKDPGELENIAHPNHPDHDPVLLERLLGKLHALVRHEIGNDQAPFSLDLFGTRKVTYREGAGGDAFAG
jgi:arylsulfatase